MNFNRNMTNGQLLPAYPLFVKDPFFSVWSPSDELNSGDTIFWTTMRRRFYGAVYAGGKTYSFLGLLDGAKKLRQKAVDLTAFSTVYYFEDEDFDFRATFTSPLPPDDLELLSCPVCYFDYEITPKKNLGKVVIALFQHEESCYDRIPYPMRGGTLKLDGYEAAWFGLKKQLVMSQSNDSSAAEWGYSYLTGQQAFYFSDEGLIRFVRSGELEFVYSPQRCKYLAAADTFENCKTVQKGFMMVAFDDTLSIFYFGEWLKGYYFEGGKTIFDALDFSAKNHDKILAQLDKFDQKLKAAAAPYGEDYLLVLYGGLRQSVGAHKLVKDKEGEVLFLSKECHSNGCIATVDVSYPSMPLFLLYNPELVKGMMRPIFKFAGMPVWNYDFAPHDVGTYPYCLGQVYALRNRKDKEYDRYNTDLRNYGDVPNSGSTFTYPMVYSFPLSAQLYNDEYQMPVEECGNMLVMTAAALIADGDATLAKNNFGMLTDWVKYLIKFGLMPGNQLCTDDFAGHLDKNINLSIKAIVGIESYALICDKIGESQTAAEMHAKAKEYAAEWKKMCVKKGVKIPLVFDGGEETFSLKYNMAFDVLFGTGLFDEQTRETEVDYYIQNADTYGINLNSRKNYTKSDWIVWTAALTGDIDKRKKLIAPIAKFLRESTSRCPFTDWYYTHTGKIVGSYGPDGILGGFKNRTVQGGLFMALLADSGKLKK